MEHWDEIVGMFGRASECIETVRQEGKDREAMISTADKSRAEKEWAEYEYGRTHAALEGIMKRCPDPALVSILGLILLPSLLRRTGQARMP